MIGTRLAHYEITRHLGSGGMGDVYQATDTKLGRGVAIKLLPEAFTHDADRATRFEREARLLASLNHSNIAAIHGIEESGGRKFLVMELVPGETLAQRIKRGPIPIDEALPIAKQIADALESAHENGIIHRDLKPANIKVTPQGRVKVLDFGLAKAFAGEAAEVNLSDSPTLSMAATNAGVILGTPAYMSPEQAKGKETDRTTDIWAFGCVLYEMLTGRAAFQGETPGEILGSVFQAEPDLKRLPVETPPAIRRLLGRCLQKDRNLRMRDAGDARLDIIEQRSDVESAPQAKGNERLARIVAMAALVGVAALAIVHFREASPVEPPETRLEIITPSAFPGRLSFFKVSPDGRKVVFSAAAEGEPSQLWLRPFESEAAQSLAGTENARAPFWSPDGRSIGFIAAGKLMRLDLTGGSPRPLADAPGGGNGAWGPDGTILFTPTETSALYRVPETGGQPVEVTRLSSSREASHRFPDFLPDGRHFLFFVAGTAGVQAVYVGSLDTTETRRLLESDSAAVFAGPDYIVFRREENLLAQRLDLKKFEMTGDSFSVAQRVSGQGAIGDIAVSASNTGVIAYRVPINASHQLRWFDRAGKETGTLGDADTWPATAFPRISPDGHNVALGRIIKGNPDVWLIEMARGVLQRFTSDSAGDRFPVWAPDSNRVAFASRRLGPENLWVKGIDDGTEKRLRESAENERPMDWSPNGRFILFGGGIDLWALPLEGEGKPVAVANTSSVENNGRFSPDGQRVAYQSDETGRDEIFVVPFPVSGVPKQVSTNGGVAPNWGKDGREILYLAPDRRLMTVSVMPLPNGKLEAGKPTALPFTIPQGESYDITRDGQRILIDKPVGQATTPPITVILNWKPKP
jgi:eukaryotic-like serine/threonine-protein kinase